MQVTTHQAGLDSSIARLALAQRIALAALAIFLMLNAVTRSSRLTRLWLANLPLIKNHQLSWWFDGEPLKAVSKDSATFGMGLWDH